MKKMSLLYVAGGLLGLLAVNVVQADDSQFMGWSASIGPAYSQSSTKIASTVDIFIPGQTQNSFSNPAQTDSKKASNAALQAGFSYGFVSPQHYYFSVGAFLANQSQKASNQSIQHIFNPGPGINSTYYGTVKVKPTSSIKYGLKLAVGYILKGDNLVYVDVGASQKTFNIIADSYLKDDSNTVSEPLSMNVNKTAVLWQYGVGYQRILSKTFALFVEFDFSNMKKINASQTDSNSESPDRVENYQLSYNSNKLMAGVTYHF